MAHGENTVTISDRNERKKVHITHTPPAISPFGRSATIAPVLSRAQRPRRRAAARCAAGRAGYVFNDRQQLRANRFSTSATGFSVAGH